MNFFDRKSAGLFRDPVYYGKVGDEVAAVLEKHGLSKTEVGFVLSTMITLLPYDILNAAISHQSIVRNEHISIEKESKMPTNQTKDLALADSLSLKEKLKKAGFAKPTSLRERMALAEKI